MRFIAKSDGNLFKTLMIQHYSISDTFSGIWSRGWSTTTRTVRPGIRDSEFPSSRVPRWSRRWRSRTPGPRTRGTTPASPQMHFRHPFKSLFQKVGGINFYHHLGSFINDVTHFVYNIGLHCHDFLHYEKSSALSSQNPWPQPLYGIFLCKTWDFKIFNLLLIFYIFTNIC